MAQFKIVGYERNAGTSKKTGRPYDMHILHVVSERPMRGENKAGYAVDKIIIGAEDCILAQIPAPGEVWEIAFNRRGYVEDAYVVE